MVEEYSCVEYIIQGEMYALNRLADVIKKVKSLCQAGEDKIFMKELFCELGFMEGHKSILFKNKKIFWNAEWEVDSIFTKEYSDGHKVYLMKIESCSQNDFAIKYLLNHLVGLCPSILYFRKVNDSSCHVTNNRDFFPEKYYVFCPDLFYNDIDDRVFMDENDVFAAFKKVYDIPDNVLCISDLKDWCNEGPRNCYICEIEEVHSMDDDEEGTLNWLVKSAEEGNAESQYKLAMMYFDQYGKIESNDRKRAYTLLRNSAKSGYKSALEFLSSEDAKKLKLSKAQRMKWIEKAAEAGIVDALNTLAESYYYSKDYERAFELFQKAEKCHREQGYGDYTNDILAIMYFDGLGCDVNYKKSAYYFDINTAEFQGSLALDDERFNTAELWKLLAKRGYTDYALNYSEYLDSVIIELYERNIYFYHEHDIVLAYCGEGYYEKALSLARKVVDYDPQGYPYELLAKALEGLGKYDEALSAYEKSLQLYKEEEDENIRKQCIKDIKKKIAKLLQKDAKLQQAKRE